MALGVSRLLKSTDASAPQFGVTVGQFKSFLKAVLVDGYGSTPSLGWTLEYESGNIAVFRMKSGTRYYVRVDDSIAGEYTYLTGFKTMDTINTGTERVPSVGLSPVFIRKRYGGTANVPWMVIGDDAGFVLAIKSKHTGSDTVVDSNQWQILYIGDYVPFDVRNKWNFCLLGSANPTSSVCGIYRHGPGVATYTHVIQRDHSWKKSSAYCGIASFLANTYFGQTSATMTGGVGTSGCKVGGSYFSIPVVLYIGALDTNTVSSTCYMGCIPGVHDPIIYDGESTANMTIDKIAPVTINGPGHTDMVVYVENNSGYTYSSTYQSSSKLMLRIGEGFRNV